MGYLRLNMIFSVQSEKCGRFQGKDDLVEAMLREHINLSSFQKLWNLNIGTILRRVRGKEQGGSLENSTVQYL